MSLKDSIRAVQTGLPITLRHETWMTNNPNPTYSREALEFAYEQLQGIRGSQRLRKRMFRASAAHDCERKQILAMAGVPKKEEIESKLAGIFATGNFLHLKWQMQGLTEGWLVQAEVPVDRPEMNAGGTMDGVLYTGGGFEFKTINDRGYQRVTNFGPLDAHIAQTHNYMLLGDIDHFSIVYENKNTGEWREFLVPRDEKKIEQARQGFGVLNDFYQTRTLPRPLDECRAKEGGTYRNCPFRDVCLGMKEWPT